MTFIEEAVISGFIGKVVSDCIDVSWSKIREADKNRKSKNQNLPTRIYQVIVDAINEVTYNKYNGQDALYDAAEDLLDGLKSGNDNRIEIVKHSLSTLIADVDNNKGVEFIEILRTEISKECNFDLYKEILIMLLEQATEYNHTQLQQIEEQLDYIIQKLGENTKPQEDNTHHRVKSRTQEYADKWNDNMFLNDFDEWDENAGTNIILSDVYIENHLPHFVWRQNKTESNNLSELLSKYIDNKIGNKMLLILGQPGIGKSTLITWIAANYISRADDILVYQFATDLKGIDWGQWHISYDILGKLGLSYDDLNGKTLIFDGFDEINIGGDRKDVLDQLYIDFIYKKNTKNFKLIITCRENYIQGLDRVKCTYITLQPWDEEQIKSFCTRFQEKTNGAISEHTIKRIVKSKEILGIPLILYMVLALNITIEKEGSIVDIYDKIFSLEGGIYDRCIENKNFADNHRIGEIKEQIHQISREIAIWMFENNPHKACIPKEQYEKICDSIMKEGVQNEDIKQDFKIGNYFKLVKHCEGVETEELYFVHRSIYEYFVAETFFTSILESIDESTEKFAGNLGELFKGNSLSGSKEILKFLKYKIRNSKLRDMFERVNETFQLMLQDGMTYHTKKNYKNVIVCELNVFANMLELLHLWDKNYLEFNKKNLFCNYLMYNKNLSLNLGAVRLYLESDDLLQNLTEGVSLCGVRLMGANLTRADLTRADLARADLTRAKLVGTILRNADLYGADLSNADLSDADLTGADLIKADLSGADLRGTIIDDMQVPFLKECGVQMNNIKVCIKATEEIVSYDVYCSRKNDISASQNSEMSD